MLYPTEVPSAGPCPLIHASSDDLACMALALATDSPPHGDLFLTAGQPGNTSFLTVPEAT